MDTCSKRWVCNCSNANFIDFYCFSPCAVINFLLPALHSLKLFMRFLISCPYGVECGAAFTAVVIVPILCRRAATVVTVLRSIPHSGEHSQPGCR